ncbi:MAG: FAD-dependent oxidoreductase [Planctomycetes bacterium]|nr:FAD-dependent oxidoreductase [Planctomycetota bacterium]
MDYDVVVIGCGSAGSRAAAAAQDAGARVLALDGAEELGGLCILRGCMPTKTLLETAHRLHDIRDAERFGIQVGSVELDFGAHMDRMRQLVARFKRAKVGSIERADYELRRASARFLDPHTLEIEGERVTTKAVVLATGSVVRPFGFECPPGVLLDSDDMFKLTAAPGRALVRGSGAVGLEFAQWLARVGTKVVLSARGRLFHRRDLELGAELEAALAEEMTVRTQSTILAVRPLEAGGVEVDLKLADGSTETHAVDVILNATGRVPNIEPLNIGAANLSPEDLRVGGDMRTPVGHVFVAGDTTGQRQILHEANLEGRIAGRNAAAVALGRDVTTTYDTTTPQVEVVFSDPPVAFLGQTPQELEAAGIPHRVALKRFPEQGRGIVVGARHGFVRLVAGEAGELLGCQMIGPRADDLIHVPTAVVRCGGGIAEMAKIPWYHPTLAEAFIEVARDLDRA